MAQISTALQLNANRLASPAALAAYRDSILGERAPNRPIIIVCHGTGCVANNSPKVADTLRRAIAAAGYDSWPTGFDPARASVHTYLRRQSDDIARAVNGDGEIGAGDQGMMIGYATRQTPELMPLPIVLAHRVVARQAAARREGLVPGLRPDAKAQVTVAYEGGRPLHVESLVLSSQHQPFC